MKGFFTKIFGSSNQRLLNQYSKIVDKINALEGLTPTDNRNLCSSVIRQLNAEYQTAIMDAVNEVRDTGRHDYVEWDTPLGFIAHQRVHKVKSKENEV